VKYIGFKGSLFLRALFHGSLSLFVPLKGQLFVVVTGIDSHN